MASDVDSIVEIFAEELDTEHWEGLTNTVRAHADSLMSDDRVLRDVLRDRDPDIVAKMFYAAVDWDCPELVGVLIRHGCDVNHGYTPPRRPHPRSPLYYAAHIGHVKIVQMLLAAGCELNERNCSGNTALYEAVFQGHIEVARLLLEHGADPNIPDCYGQTPLHVLPFCYASSAITAKIVHLLMSHGADLSRLSSSNQSVADVAIQYGFELSLRYIMEYTQECNIREIPHCPDVLGDRVLPELIMFNQMFPQSMATDLSSHHGHSIGTILVQLHPCHHIGHHTLEEFLRICDTKDDPHFNFHADARRFRRLMLISGVPGIRTKVTLTLQELCRIAIRRHLKQQCWFACPRLPIPKGLQDFLQLRDVVKWNPQQFDE